MSTEDRASIEWIPLSAAQDKVKEEPLLGLSAIAPAPAGPRPFGQIVLQPTRQLRDQFDRAHVGFFPELALRRRLRASAPSRKTTQARLHSPGPKAARHRQRRHP